MVDHLEKLTREQSKSKNWFLYRAGRITASWLKQVICTDPHQPSLSLLKSVCYPDIHRFSNKATAWGCEHEKEALQLYQTKVSALHEGLKISNCGFFVSAEHPYLGASPDALMQCTCCGQGTIEIKCPWCAREASLQEAVEQSKNFCLNKLSDGKFQLHHDHGYYYQCQMQLFVTGRSFCDYIVWTPNEIHIERITLDEDLLQTVLPQIERFWKLCVLPELLGKWYTRQQFPPLPSTSFQAPIEEEDTGKWCFCREDKGGEMIACDGKSCHITWYHLECLGMTQSSVPHGKWLCPTCHANKHKKTTKAV